MEFKDYYAILGVPHTATSEEVKKSYRKLARKYHPDVSKEPDARHRMAEINEANEVISDPERRAAYDELVRRREAGHHAEFEPPPDWAQAHHFDFAGGDEDYSDFFSQLFGRAARASQARRTGAEPRMHGEDRHARVEIDLRDAYEGATRTLTLRGARLDERGRVVADERTLQVQIPRGVKAGQQIRLAGQGGAGYGGAPAGDLYLEVAFAPDQRYQVDGRDVTQTVPVAPWEAALGASIEVPTPSGRVHLTVPPNSRPGRRLRLKGRGIPGSPAGDLYVQLEIALPSAERPAARALYEQMARELADFDARAALKGE
ncbi:MAG TPA: DnaJ C-terminal domain-containing protein [Ideonella sp.]|nr:DnaJ C-terminal domain-containing protein [Ideonella sp.]